MQISELIKKTTQILNENKIEDSNIKARVLLQHILKQNTSYLITNYNEEISKENETLYEQYIQELIQGKPLQYITNTQEFMGLNFYVDENVLIPQPDTEILVEEAIKEIEKKIKDTLISRKTENKEDIKQEDRTQLQENKYIIRVLDMCTGSGAIAISIAKHFQNNSTHKELNQHKNESKANVESNIQSVQIEVYGLDISEEALKIAKRNAKTNQVKITFLKSNMFEEIREHMKEKFDVIVSNPPYIETETIKTLPEEVKQEPHIALDGGEDGLTFYKIIAEQGYSYLKEKRKYSSRNRIQSKRKCNKIV